MDDNQGIPETSQNQGNTDQEPQEPALVPIPSPDPRLRMRLTEGLRTQCEPIPPCDKNLVQRIALSRPEEPPPETNQE